MLVSRIKEFAQVVTNSRNIIAPKEIDIYLPEHKLAIEVNGLYWHSMFAGKTPRLYHNQKMLLCKDAGVRLLQFWDFEILDNIDLVVSMIRNACGFSASRIFARKCSVVDVPKQVAKDFIRQNHLAPECRFSSALGLTHNGTLVSVIAVSKSRFRKGCTEIVRFCSKQGASIVGGFSRLVKHLDCGDIVSYSDNRYSEGGVYKASGFEKAAEGNATMWFTPDYKSLIHRSVAWKMQRREGETQIDAALRLGYDVVYDAGQTTWLLERA